MERDPAIVAAVIERNVKWGHVCLESQPWRCLPSNFGSQYLLAKAHRVES